MTLESLRDLYVHKLCDLYDAEKQLVKTLPDVADAATAPDLRQAILHHLEQTRHHVTTVAECAAKLGCDITRVSCKGMKGILKEGDSLIDDATNETRDAAIIAGCQAVEHYEIAGYGTARTYAKLLGQTEAVHMLQAILDEEKQADLQMTQLAESHINVEAMTQHQRAA